MSVNRRDFLGAAVAASLASSLDAQDKSKNDAPRPAEPSGTFKRPIIVCANNGVNYLDDAFAKNGPFCDQAQHKMAFVRKIVEMTGMHAHSGLAQQANRQVFVTLDGGNAKHDVPSALDQQP